MRSPALVSLIVSLRLCAADVELVQINKEKLPDAIREAARQTEQRHPKAQGLAARVEVILNMKPPVVPKEDRRAQLAQQMTVNPLAFNLNPSVEGRGGVILDRTPSSLERQYAFLESQKRTGGADVRRLLEMADLASILGDEPRKNRCLERAVELARAMIAAEPGGAEGHALLADALGWRKGLEQQTLEALRQALKWDPQEPLARFLMASRELEQQVHEVFSRSSARLEDRLSSELELVEKCLEKPMTPVERTVLEKRLEAFPRRLSEIMRTAQEKKDFALFCRLWRSEMSLFSPMILAEISVKHPPGATVQDVKNVLMQTMLQHYMLILAHPSEARVAIELAGDDMEKLGGVLLSHSLGLMLAASREGRTPNAKELETLQATIQRLEEKGRALTGPPAARALEMLVMMDASLSMAGMTGRTHPEALLEALRNDPEGTRTQNILIGLTRGEPASYALAEIQHAQSPSPATHRACAAAAAYLADWDEAFRHLEAAQTSASDSLEFLNQRVATVLRRSQDKDAMAKARELYGAIQPDTLLPKARQLQPEVSGLVVSNYILFLVLDEQREKASALLREALAAGILKEAEAQELRRQASQ